MKIEYSKSIPKWQRKFIAQAIRISDSEKPMQVNRLMVTKATGIDKHHILGAIRVIPSGLQMRINTDFDAMEILDTVFHECLHGYQYAQGWLKVDSDAKAFIWKKYRIPFWLYSRIHGLIPFEREAIKYAKRMTKKYFEVY